jgi:hypothetical protein
MGDRCNVYVNGADVFLYGHWSGWTIAQTVRDALKRGRERWNDAPYLARIVLCEMVRGSFEELTGFGISRKLCDNERPIIVLDPDNRVASVMRVSRWGGDGPMPPLGSLMPFSRLIEMSDDDVRRWHLGDEGVSP